ncbi:hypothetical protein ACN28E_24975 [Archangium lansingense]|uniref:hypothetical protein n=1 Tax=Archangium lansingense TaxID=2995310 RepID=UPI003B7C6BCD
MNIPKTHIGAAVKTNNLGVTPSVQSVGTRAGPALSPSEWMSGVLTASTGAVTGSPSAISVTYGLETRDSSTSPAGPWVALEDMDGNPVEVEITAANTCKEVDFDLTYVPEGHTELRVTETVALSNGSTPTVASSAVLVLGGANRLPV